MSDLTKKVELSDEIMERVSGGVIIAPDGVVNRETGQKYAWLNPNYAGAFGFVCELGDVPEADKIAAMQAAGFIGGEI